METEQITYNFHKDSDFYRFRNRSCTNCERRDMCRALQKDWSQKWLDMARCGAVCYVGPHENEVAVKKTM